jgi:LPS sulfotransferase NodH
MSVTRFILLGRPRTGSTLLQTLLDTHSQVRVFGELFALYNLPGWGIEPILQSPQSIELIQKRPISFLEDYFFGSVCRRLIASPFKPHLRALGFKLFYDHAHEEPWQAVWTYVKERTELKIVHIKRRNILEAHLSHRRAQANRSWISTPRNEEQAEQDSELRLHLDYDECLRAFTYTRDQERLCDEMFGRHQRIDIFYEDLAQSLPAETDRVQDFLEVSREQLNPHTRKQASLPPEIEIANYRELKERFQGSVWEEFFTG